MKKLIGVFNPRKMTPEQIYKKAQGTLQEQERLNLLKLAKERGTKRKQ